MEPKPASENNLRLAALDLGSTTSRLLLAEKIGSKIHVRDVISKNVRLGQGLLRNSMLSHEARERTYVALDMAMKKINAFAPHRIRAVTTEACRKAKNAPRFLEKIENELGLKIEIISQEEEARLVLRGCLGIIETSYDYVLLFDIGGGSTEIIFAAILPEGHLQIIDVVSLPIGVVTLADLYPQETRQAYREIHDKTQALIQEFEVRNNIRHYITQDRVQVIGSSGTATTTALMHLGLRHHQKHQVDGAILSHDDLKATIKYGQMLPKDVRSFQYSIGTERSDLIFGGLAILEGIIDMWPAPYLHVADRGVREGLIAELAFGSELPMIPSTSPIIRVA